MLQTPRREKDRQSAGVGLRRIAIPLVRIWRAWRARREILELLRFDEKTLLDMGITRLDVVNALSLPLWKDPSRALLRARRQRIAASGMRQSRAGGAGSEPEAQTLRANPPKR